MLACARVPACVRACDHLGRVLTQGSQWRRPTEGMLRLRRQGGAHGDRLKRDDPLRLEQDDRVVQDLRRVESKQAGGPFPSRVHRPVTNDSRSARRVLRALLFGRAGAERGSAAARCAGAALNGT